MKRVVISDTHIGTKFYKSEELLAFLEDLSCDELVLAGDIIDFIKIPVFTERCLQIIEKMNSLLSNDAMRPHIAGFTKLGLLEMTRRKRGSSLSEILGRQTSEFCKSIETIALEIFREVIKVTKLGPTTTLNILAAPSVVEILNGEMNDTLKEVQKNLGVKLKLTAEPNNKEEIFQISSSKKKK
mgnify:CR=1 FL=1